MNGSSHGLTVVVSRWTLSRFLRFLAAVCLFGVILEAGCATKARQHVVTDEEALSRVTGRATRDGFIKLWGPPDSRAAVSDGEVCVWRFSKGVRATATSSDFGVFADSREAYDKFVLTFDKTGVLREWRIQRQR